MGRSLFPVDTSFLSASPSPDTVLGTGIVTVGTGPEVMCVPPSMLNLSPSVREDRVARAAGGEMGGL